MNFVETVAPISIENLKKYFTDKTTFFVINYKDSSLKGNKLITYLSNLDIPCDISFNGCDVNECYDLLKDYLNSSSLVSIPSLESLTINVLHQYKKLRNQTDIGFIEANLEIIEKWVSKLDSLTLYNMNIIANGTFKEFNERFENDPTDEMNGINFVSLLKNDYFYSFYETIDKSKLKVYPHYFNDYMFKGKNLYTYWANENNPLFLLTFGIAEGMITGETYNSAKQQTLEELANATPV